MPDDQATVFVRLDAYKDLTDILALTRERIKQAKFMLDRIAEIKHREDAELQAWAAQLGEVEQRVEEIDHALLRPQDR